MSDARPVLVLDADGVFLSERPYWNAALGAALDLAGVARSVGDSWNAVADNAFGTLGLQRVTKSRGCNSNWDLAAVLVRALDEPPVRDAIAGMLADGRRLEAMQLLAKAGDQVWGQAGRPTQDRDDPLNGAGIDRHGAFYATVVEKFQQVLFGTAGIGWNFERWQLAGDRDRSTDAFEQLVDRGYRLKVCTGRHRAEIEEPIRLLGLAGWLPSDTITSADEVDQAQSESGSPSLGKPHWFPPACAVVGYAAALAALNGGSLPENGTRTVYAGDAWADFRAVQGCRERGLKLDYIHVRSGATTAAQERAITDVSETMGVVDRFDAIPGLLS